LFGPKDASSDGKSEHTTQFSTAAALERYEEAMEYHNKASLYQL
jgi:hypothetical protein